MPVDFIFVDVANFQMELGLATFCTPTTGCAPTSVDQNCASAEHNANFS